MSDTTVTRRKNQSSDENKNEEELSASLSALSLLNLMSPLLPIENYLECKDILNLSQLNRKCKLDF